MATASPSVETIEEVTETAPTPQRGRKKGKKLFGHDKVYESKEDAQSNEPYYSNEKLVKTKDASGKEVESIEYEGEEAVDGFRIYQVNVSVSPEAGADNFIWARSGDMALANWAGQFAIAELTDAQSRGRAKKIDNIYLMFFKSLIAQNQVKELLETLQKEQLLHYLPHLGIDAEGKKVETNQATAA